MDRLLMALARTIHSGRLMGLHGVAVTRWPDDGQGRLLVAYDGQIVEIDATVRGLIEPTDDEAPGEKA